MNLCLSNCGSPLVRTVSAQTVAALRKVSELSSMVVTWVKQVASC